MKKPPKQFFLWWAIETPKKHLLINTTSADETEAWVKFVGHLGITSRLRAKAKGYASVRVIIHKPQLNWDTFRTAPELNIHSR